MLPKTQVLICCLLAISKVVTARRQFIIVIDDVTCFGYGEPVSQVGCQLETFENHTVINAFIVLSQEVKAFEIKATSEFPRNGTIAKLFDFTADGCKTLDTMDSINILKVAVTFIRRSGHIPKKCPLAANENFTLSRFALDPDMLPAYTPEFSYVTNLRAFIGTNMVARVLAKGRIEMKRKQIH